MDSKSIIIERLKITGVHVMICFLIYLIMYGLMSYNVIVIFAIIFGNVVGYYIFGISGKYKRMISNVGCCHSG